MHTLYGLTNPSAFWKSARVNLIQLLLDKLHSVWQHQAALQLSDLSSDLHIHSSVWAQAFGLRISCFGLNWQDIASSPGIEAFCINWVDDAFSRLEKSSLLLLFVILSWLLL